MQNKGLVKFFAILFALVSIYQLSFTFVANKVKSDAKSFAGNNPDKEIKYLDSIGKEKVFSLGFTDFTYNEVKDKQINKGLDLEGGINVILQISVKDVLKGLSNNSKNVKSGIVEKMLFRKRTGYIFIQFSPSFLPLST